MNHELLCNLITPRIFIKTACMKKVSIALIFVIFCTANAFAQKAHIHINLDRVIMRINDSLMKYVSYHPQVKLMNDSVFIIQHDAATQFRVNILRLKQTVPAIRYHRYGIEFQPLNEKAHVPVSYIFFHGGPDAFIKFYGVNNETVENIHGLFIRMYELMKAYMRPWKRSN
jgi:hypothetical protein